MSGMLLLRLCAECIYIYIRMTNLRVDDLIFKCANSKCICQIFEHVCNCVREKFDLAKTVFEINVRYSINN